MTSGPSCCALRSIATEPHFPLGCSQPVIKYGRDTKACLFRADLGLLWRQTGSQTSSLNLPPRERQPEMTLYLSFLPSLHFRSGLHCALTASSAFSLKVISLIKSLHLQLHLSSASQKTPTTTLNLCDLKTHAFIKNK